MASPERGWAAALVLLLAAGTAGAQAPGENAATARELFDQGRALMAEKDYARACPKLEEAQRIDPGGGTILNLALCNELLGKTATAWAQFEEALRWARRDGRADREKFATEHLEGLTPALARLVVKLEPGANVPELTVTRDGLPLGEASFGEALPVDPGDHVIEASAPGKRPHQVSVKASAGAVQVVAIPVLEDVPVVETAPPASTAPARPVAPRPAPAAVEPGDSSGTWGAVLLGTGAALVAGGAYFGFTALSHSNDANDVCPERECTDRDAVDLSEQARTEALVSTLLVAGGLGVAGVGTYFLLSAGPDKSGALVLRGKF